MLRILWISMCVPYDKVAHAGGQIENFYVKGLNKSIPVSMITFANYDEMELVDLDSYGIEADVYVAPKWSIRKFIYALTKRLRGWNPFSSKLILEPWQEFFIKRNLLRRKENGDIPSVIVIEWTQPILLTDWIKKQFPGVPVIAIEEDVSFLSYERQYLSEKNFLFRHYKKKKYTTLKKSELFQLGYADLVILNNYKDYNLLLQKGICKEKMWVWTPYFQSMKDLVYIGDTKDILFYGAMGRYENYASAIWFIKNVLYKIKDPDVRLIILGSRPHPSLQKYAGNRVVITGFVDDIRPYFQHSLCLVAPLILGAGIKIKIIESLTAGLPILTNDIGIEGIPAEDGKSYYHCNTPDDYIEKIQFLLNNKSYAKVMSDNEKKLADEIYDYDKSLEIFVKKVTDMVFKE